MVSINNWCNTIFPDLFPTNLALCNSRSFLVKVFSLSFSTQSIVKTLINSRLFHLINKYFTFPQGINSVLLISVLCRSFFKIYLYHKSNIWPKLWPEIYRCKDNNKAKNSSQTKIILSVTRLPKQNSRFVYNSDMRKDHW